MIYTPMTRKALNIAYKAHEGQTDASGLPYIFHPYHIAEQMADEVTTCVALLHDVLEDTGIEKQALAGEFPEEVMEALTLLCRDDSVPYMDYIRRIKPNPVARAVKLADIAHNSDESRLNGVRIPKERLEHWREKYTEAKRYLEE